MICRESRAHNRPVIVITRHTIMITRHDMVITHHAIVITSWKQKFKLKVVTDVEAKAKEFWFFSTVCFGMPYVCFSVWTEFRICLQSFYYGGFCSRSAAKSDFDFEFHREGILIILSIILHYCFFSHGFTSFRTQDQWKVCKFMQAC